MNTRTKSKTWLVHPIPCGMGIAFLLESAEGSYLIDTGTPHHEAQILAALKQLGRTDLKLIWITHAHYDHYGSAAALRAITGAKIGVHAADAPFLKAGQSPLGSSHQYGFIYPLGQPILNHFRPLPPTEPDFILRDGDSLQSLGLDAYVLHTPGHTPGHTCLLLADGTAFAGDLIYGGTHPGLQRLLAVDWEQLPASLARLQAAKPERIFTGHADTPLSGEALQQIHP